MANDVVFLLRFNTKEGENQVRLLSTQAKSLLTKALSVTPKTASLSDALGIKTATTDVTRLQLAMSKLEGIMQHFRYRSRSGVTGIGLGLDEESIRSRLATQERRIKQAYHRTQNPQGRSTYRDPDTGQFLGTFSAGGQLVTDPSKLTTDEIVRLLEYEAKIRKNQINQIERSAAEIAKADAERLAARKAEAQQIVANIRRMARLQAAEEVIAARQAFNANSQLGLMPGSPVVTSGTSDFSGLGGTNSRQRFDPNAQLGIMPGMGTGQRLPNPQGHVGSGGLGPGFGPRPIPQQGQGAANALGISPTATYLLALSSVLAPLNSQLGMVAMQAGFAAFSLGAPVAALSILSSALAGFTAVLKNSVSVAKEAGLETRNYARATIALELEMQTFMKTIGVKVQEAFVPVVNELTDLFREVEKLPWDDIISASAEASKGLLQVVDYLVMVQKQSGLFMFQRQADWLQDRAGLKGTQRIDLGKIFGSAMSGGFGLLGLGSGFKTLFDEFRDAFRPDQPQSVEFVHTPKFNFEEVDKLHRSIQESIFKQYEKDPHLRAQEQANAYLRGIFNAVDGLNRKTSDTIEEVTTAVPILG